MTKVGVVNSRDLTPTTQHAQAEINKTLYALWYPGRKPQCYLGI